MKHVKLDSQEEAVKRFVLALSVEPGASVLELDGKAVVCVVPAAELVTRAPGAVDWTETKNTRRCQLIDREIDGTITPADAVELQQLQNELLRYQSQVAPWPLEAARRLHQELLGKAAAAQGGPDA
jgi:hypothetical protein